jgi:hypothetical protein
LTDAKSNDGTAEDDAEVDRTCDDEIDTVVVTAATEVVDTATLETVLATLASVVVE